MLLVVVGKGSFCAPVGVGSLLASHRGGRTLGELVERLQPAVATTAVATMYRFCLQSFDVTDQVPARHLLRLIATFAPDEALPVHLFDDAAEFKTYADHPLHKEFVSKYRKYFDPKVTVFDFVEALYHRWEPGVDMPGCT